MVGGSFGIWRTRELLAEFSQRQLNELQETNRITRIARG